MFRHGKTIGSDRPDKSVFRLDDHLAIAIDQAGLAFDVDLREAEFVVVDDAIPRRDDLASFLVDEAVETAEADGSSVVRERADPIVLRGHRDRAVATDRATQAAWKRARRKRKGERPGRCGRTVIHGLEVCRDLALQDSLAGGRQVPRL